MKNQILDIMNKKDYLPLNIDELYNLLNLNSASDFTLLAKTLNQMVDEKLIIYNSKGQFAPLAYFNIAYGIIDVKDAGFAFLDTEYGSIFIPYSALNGALTYDEVMVKYNFDSKGRLEGEVLEIVKRNNTELVGIISKYHGKYVVKPLDYKIHLQVFVKKEDINHVVSGDIVKVKIDTFCQNHTADGVIIKSYGNKNLPGLDITGLVLAKNIRTEFSNEAVEELQVIPTSINANEEMTKNPKRRDLRNKPIITIDGDDA